MNNDNTTPHDAVSYDKKVRATIPFYEIFHSQTIDLVKTVRPNPKLWLDTGCGTGYLVREAVKIFKDTNFILADPSDRMIDECRQNLQGMQNISIFEPVDTVRLKDKIKKNTDVITAIQAHHYLNEDARIKSTNVIYQLLEDRGLYITFENIKPDTYIGIDYGLKRWLDFQIDKGRSIEEVNNHRLRFNTKYFPITVEKHIKILYDAGFSAVELFWFSYMQAGFYAVK